MPPKKTVKKPSAKEPPPEKYWRDRLVGWKKNQPSADVKDALLPFLSEGFVPVPNTGGATLRCGYYSLRDSLKALQKWLPGLFPKDTRITIGLLQSMTKSDSYLAKVQMELNYSKGAGQDHKALEKHHASGVNLDAQQLQWILHALNEQWGTNLHLGVIMQGYWCTYRFSKGRKQWDYNDENHHQATTRDMETGKLSNQTVVWVWNDNTEAKNSRWGLGDQSVGHWEGFDIQNNSENHKQRVRDWGFGADIRSDVERGVWVVRRDCPGGRDGYLDVRIGHFVRNHPAPKGVVIPSGYKYMRTCQISPGISHGLVHERNLAQITVDNAPEPLDKDYVPYIEPPAGTDQDADEIDFGDADNAGTVTTSGVPAKEQGQQFRFFRAVEASMKNGKRYPSDDASNSMFGAVDSFTFRNGDFFLDQETREQETNYATVLNITGTRGRVHLRRLQHVERPWLLPTHLPTINSEIGTLFENIETLDDQLNALLRDSSLVPAAIKADKLKQLKHISEPLPLYEVREDSEWSFSQITRFYAGEIVRLMEKPSSNNGPGYEYSVVDYEGQRGRILWTNLRRIDTPFGIIVNVGKFGKGLFGSPPADLVPLLPAFTFAPAPAPADDSADGPPTKKQKTSTGVAASMATDNSEK